MASIASPPPIVGHVKSYREPDNICHTCKEYWATRKPPKHPRILVELPQRGDFGMRIFVCPWCDGPVAERASAT